MLPFPSGPFSVRPDVSSDITSPVEPTQNRWALTSARVAVVEAVTFQSEGGGKMKAHERSAKDVAVPLVFLKD